MLICTDILDSGKWRFSNSEDKSVSEMLKDIFTSISTQGSQHSIAVKHIPKHFLRITLRN